MVITSGSCRAGAGAVDPRPFALRGQLVIDGRLVPGAVVVEAGRIAAVHQGAGALDLPPAVVDASVVSPGFLDLQVNGGFGVDAAESANALRHLSSHLPSTGVTSFLPTLVSSPPETYPRFLDLVEKARGAEGAEPLGLHLEGPFLSVIRAGAHRIEAIQGASPDILEPLVTSGVLKLVTLAPELPGSLERIRVLRAHGVVVSLGHTDASYEEFVGGIEAGATLVTHLYNAMSAFGHRAPGAVGGALVDDRVSVALIADGVHCHPASVRLALKAKGPERVALVTDAIAGAGTRPGTSRLGGQEIHVDDTSARLPNGTLAGSVLTLDRAVRNVAEWGGIGFAEACRMASEVPANILGLPQKGRLQAGADADLVLLDDRGEVSQTLIAGRTVYTKTGSS